MGSTVEVERVTVGATPSSPRRVGEAPGSDGGQLALVDTEAALLPPPLPLQRRLAVSKRLHPRSRQTLLVGDPPLAPRKALKVNVSSSAHQAAEAQAGVRRGAAPGEAVSEETAAQEKEEQVEEEEPMPRDVVGLGAEAGASAVAEATEGEAGAPETSDVRAVDAEAIGVAVAEARAPGSVETEAMEVETGALGNTGGNVDEDDTGRLSELIAQAEVGLQAKEDEDDTGRLSELIALAEVGLQAEEDDDAFFTQATAAVDEAEAAYYRRQAGQSNGMRDVRDSPPPVPEDARRRAVNRAHAKAQKRWKDAKVAKHTRKILAREELEKRRCRKRPAEVPTLAPLKALKVSPGSTAHWVVEVQAAIQRGAVSARADPKEPAAQGGATEATPTQMGEGAPPPREAEAHDLDGAEAPSVAEATEVEAPRASEAEATEAKAPRITEAAAAGAGAPGTTEATMAEAGAPGTTEADVIAAKPWAHEVEMKAAEASMAPLVQGPPPLRESAREVEVHPISSDDTS
ncbi:uncharacterized protein [Miscanthus floridulus]|uniref:uncharacterized protein n=1 Tax=Miscanthus floridulus TaxID=154761 RepID=UPI0034593FFC